ncbi:DNA phosphorothioation-dependent restriction protein DptF [Bacillus aerolatus]|nr:DNA phosphorothioation-dependent restriction protein DptF [Bacillus aerolatus]
MGQYCSFLEPFNKELYDIALKIDDLIFLESASALVKSRTFVESLVEDIFNREKYEAIYNVSLKDRIEKLYQRKVFKNQVYEAMSFIRINGNKAAHESSGDYIINALKAHRVIHQLSKWYINKYLGEEIVLPDYKEPKAKQPEIDKEMIEQLVQQHIKELAGEKALHPSPIVEPSEGAEESEAPKEYALEPLKEGRSYLVRELERLRASSKEALENADKGSFDHFKNYLHVERPIQNLVEEALENAKNQERTLIFLAGSVGDGKSHLISYLQQNKPKLVEDFLIINDATESDDPRKSSLETLAEKLSAFSDKDDPKKPQKVIVAINLGVINNFISTTFEQQSFERIHQFIHESSLFSNEAKMMVANNEFTLINFSASQPFTLTEGKMFSSYFLRLMERVTTPSLENPFYAAYRKDIENGINTIVHLNFDLLSDSEFQNKIDLLLCQVILKDKLVVSTRSFLNFLADILIPSDVDVFELRQENLLEHERLSYSLVNLLFTRGERSDILRAFAEMDPIHTRDHFFDQVMNDLYNLNYFNKSIQKYLKDHITSTLFEPIAKLMENDTEETVVGDQTLKLITETFIRSIYLTNKVKIEQEEIFSLYANYLYAYNRQDKRVLQKLYGLVHSAVINWRGSPKQGYVYLNKLTENYRVAQKLNFEPVFGMKKAILEKEMDTFEGVIRLYVSYDVDHPEDAICLEIDYPLFILLYHVTRGYRPSNQDQEDGLTFVHFMESILRIGKKNQPLLIHHHENKEFYKLNQNVFTSSYAFEKVEQ